MGILSYAKVNDSTGRVRINADVADNIPSAHSIKKCNNPGVGDIAVNIILF